eukprot:7262790-Prymnesium_polylepis.1
MKYVPALVVATALLLGPMVACAEGVLLGVEHFPGPWTIVGGLVILMGGTLIALQAQNQSTSVEL